MVLVVYGEETEYFHYVASSPEEKSDHWFLAQTWKEFIMEPSIAQATTINIWSDGASHHFKSTPTLTFFLQLQKEKGIQIYCNFFASYHGHTGCDTEAAHAKTSINNKMRNDHIALTTPKEITNLLNKTPRVKARIAPIPKRSIKATEDNFPTYDSIRTPHFFIFFENHIYALKHTPTNIKQIKNTAEQIINRGEQTKETKRKNKDSKNTYGKEYFIWSCVTFNFFEEYE